MSELKKLPDECIDCCVTSPPYWGLRDYNNKRQIGLEKTPELFIESLLDVFVEVQRVLNKRSTLWINIGDSYASASKKRTTEQAARKSKLQGTIDGQIACKNQITKIVSGLKAKDLVGIPWMLAFALRSAGYYLRQDIIWNKKFCLPESVNDRCTKSHEYIFLFSKSSKYYYDQESIMEDSVYDIDGNGTIKRRKRQNGKNKSNPDSLRNGVRMAYPNGKSLGAVKTITNKRNKRSVWLVSPASFPEAHFATFPEDLIVDCIKAGCPEGGIVLDPFMGAGTTALVSRKLNRNFIGIELNPDYIKIADKRLKKELGMFL